MAKRTFTVGMAGHIDHGKTTLTKALTDIDTDRLREEKERRISIEPGFAPLSLGADLDVSIIDVPGHERFIRQMIAGVAGIDAVILVVAADEGVMPQTKEHLEILSLLGVKGGLIAVTKMDKVDEELLEMAGEDIREQVQGTPFATSGMVYVDSVSGRGIDELREKLTNLLAPLPVKSTEGAFRLPVDQVFSVHGQGTVVRGTVYEGTVKEGETVRVLPANKQIRVKQLQVHGKRVTEGLAGQRLALNITGLTKTEITRGDVVAGGEEYITTSVLNVVLFVSDSLAFPVKQRGPIKLHLGTAEVYGKIVFFDRNILKHDTDQVLCQLRLNQPVVTKREDRFILRRPSPVETIGGGWIINPLGDRMKFGVETIKRLEAELEGTPEDHIRESLREHTWLLREELAKFTGLTGEEIRALTEKMKDEQIIDEFANKKLYLQTTFNQFAKQLIEELTEYHEAYPLRVGKNKEELNVKMTDMPSSAADQFLQLAEQNGQIVKVDQFIALPNHQPFFPRGWEKRMQQAVGCLQADGLSVGKWTDYTNTQQLPADLAEELKLSLRQTGKAVAMDDQHIWSRKAVDSAVQTLREHSPASFTLQEAKDILQLSRKYLVPFLEWMDEINMTKRQENERIWRKK
ncbi:selenocysteine-specific translation elongation factor [Bacillus piscicola]|uniref:selenocysteine-specific translation elongation factor n=1 Tax=Bacillus piscicola TaxID=1632684 RepID=UPI001F091BBF|nr:selenocysteine-specific translation elongation factor [Bacillus piscicola]